MSWLDQQAHSLDKFVDYLLCPPDHSWKDVQENLFVSKIRPVV